MEKMIGTWRPVIAMLLALCMVVGICPVVAFADDPESTATYVSLGDSVTNGFGMPGYTSTQYGYLQHAEAAWTSRLADRYGWNHVPLAVSAYRAEDIYGLLTFDGVNDSDNDIAIEEDYYWKGFEVDTCVSIPDGNGGYRRLAITEMAAKFQSSVKNADVISLQIGGNNFSNFLSGRLYYELEHTFGMPDLSSNEDSIQIDMDALKARMEELSPEDAELAMIIYERLLNTLLAKLGPDASAEVKGFCERMAIHGSYSMVGYMLGYSGVLAYINENNNDAMLILVGLPNTLAELAIDTDSDGETDLDIGEYVAVMLDAANRYALSRASSYKNLNIYCAEAEMIPDDDLIFAKEMRALEENPAVREKIVYEINDTVFPVVNDSGFGVTLSDVQYDSQNNAAKGDELSVAFYNAFEAAIVEAVAMPVIDIGVFDGIVGGMDGIFDEISNVLNEKVYTLGMADVNSWKNSDAGKAAISAAGMDDPTENEILAAYAAAHGCTETEQERIGNWLVDYFADKYLVSVVNDSLSEELRKNATIMGLLHLMGRFVVGGGIGIHPNAHGHNKYYEAICKALDEDNSIRNATYAKYTVSEDSCYIALGDSSATSVSYAELLSAELALEADQFGNLAEKGQTVTDAILVAEKRSEEIAKADLITLGYSNNTFVEAAIDGVYAILLDDPLELDWANCVDEASVGRIESLFAQINAELASAGMTDSIFGVTKADLLTTLLECYAYSAVSYTKYLPVLADTIHRMNPETLVVIVGMYNPLEDVILVDGDMELPLGKYVAYVLDIIRVETLRYTMHSENVIYVDAPDVEIDSTATALELLDFVELYTSGTREKLDPNVVGMQYIQQEILDALDVTICEDKDRDHKCDHGCGKFCGKHGDKNADHICDYGCKESIGICEDKDLDHACDYGCNKVFGEHKDTNKDHKCDYGCKDSIGKHEDKNADHRCDYNCNTSIGEHKDGDNDHFCNYCGEEMNPCADADKNHKCDTCGAELSKCADADKNHKCDTCGAELSKCADTDKNHKCDTCGTELTKCADGNSDGKCDVCGAQVTVEEKDEVIRIGGSVRSETARMIADELKETLKVDKFDAIVYAAGDAYPDALTGTYLANLNDAPILLYRKAQMAKNLDYIQANLAKDGTVYILGGESAIPATVDAELEKAGIKVERLAGKSRYTTNIEILNETGFKGGETVLVCSGNDYPDALAASATGMPMLLVNNKLGKLNDDQTAYLKGLNKCDFILIGGESAISAKLANELAGYDKDGKIERIEGETRYVTCQKIADKFFADADKAIVAMGTNYPDALCGGTLGYAMKSPIILVRDSRAQFVADYLEKEDIDSGYVLGGTKVLTDTLATKVFGLKNANEITVR